MFAQFEEGNILTETRNDTKIGDEYNNESIMMSEQDMDVINDSLSDSSPFSASLWFLVNMSPSSNCANVMISPVCSLEDVPYDVYVTAGLINISSE